MSPEPTVPVSNPATQAYATDLNEPLSESTESQRPERSWWWKLRAALGVLPRRQATDRDLRLAIRGEDADEVMRLLEEGVVPSRFPDTPWLCLATRRQNKTLLDLLLVHGALVDQVDRETRGARGRTALHEAAKRGWTKGSRLLLEAGADPNHSDDQGHTPLFLAVRRGHPEVVRLLLEAGAEIAPAGRRQPLLHEATAPEVVDMVVQAGGDVNLPDARGFPPIHQQAKMGRPEVLRRLLFHRARPNAEDRHGRTAVFWLGKGQAQEALAALAEAGVDLEHTDAEGNTAAHALPLRTRDEQLLANLYRRAPEAWRRPNQAGETALFVLARAGRQTLADTLEADLAARTQTD